MFISKHIIAQKKAIARTLCALLFVLLALSPLAQDRSRRFPQYVAASFLPSDVSGLTCWLKADAIVGLSDGDAIATWEDSSSENNDGTQATGTNQPTYQTNEINSKPIVRFDGSNDYFSLPNAFSAFTAAEVFLVIKIDNDPPLSSFPSGLWKFGSSASTDHFPFTDSNVYDGFGSTARKSTGNPSSSLASAFRLYNVVTQSGEWTSRIDTVQHFTTATNTVGFNTSPTFGRGLDTNYVIDGDVAEICIYNAVLSSGDRSSMQTYFDSKYALSYAQDWAAWLILMLLLPDILRRLRRRQPRRT